MKIPKSEKTKTLESWEPPEDPATEYCDWSRTLDLSRIADAIEHIELIDIPELARILISKNY